MACEAEAQNIRHLYHSLESVLSILRKDEFACFDEVKQLLSIYSSSYRRNSITGSKQNKPFIVLEGLDGSGKTTTVKKLAKALDGIKYNTPPRVVELLRPRFDDHPPILRRAYYALGNYMAASEIAETITSQPVILDRFWHSTAVFTIATDLQQSGVGLEGLPPRGDPIYCWPQDLKPVPDAIFYLDVKEHIRSQRLSKRKDTTEEEAQMASSVEFRSLLKEAYLRMATPGVTVINSNQPVKRVVNDILSFMENNKIIVEN